MCIIGDWLDWSQVWLSLTTLTGVFIMSTDFTVSAELRSEMGKGASRRLRREGKVPAIVYGTAKEAQSITLLHHKIMHSLANEAFYSTILTLDVAGDAQQVVLKDVQRHPFKPAVFHLDFLRIDAAAKLTMQIPLHFINEDECVGVKQGGGIISHLENQVETSCLPINLPEYLEVDLSQVELDQTVHLSDIKLPEGVELVDLMAESPNDLPIASVHLPKVVEDASLEGEVIAPENPEADAAGDDGDTDTDTDTDTKADGGK